MTIMNIDAPRVITRSDFTIERGALGVAYFIRGPHNFVWMPPTVALDYNRAEDIITSLLRDAEANEANRDVMYMD